MDLLLTEALTQCIFTDTEYLFSAPTGVSPKSTQLQRYWMDLGGFVVSVAIGSLRWFCRRRASRRTSGGSPLYKRPQLEVFFIEVEGSPPHDILNPSVA